MGRAVQPAERARGVLAGRARVVAAVGARAAGRIRVRTCARGGARQGAHGHRRVCRRACPSRCVVNAFLLEAQNARPFGPPRRLNAEPVPFAWTAQGRLGDTSGSMLGDYFGLVYVHGRPVPLVTLARGRAGAGFRQALFAGLRVARGQ